MHVGGRQLLGIQAWSQMSKNLKICSWEAIKEVRLQAQSGFILLKGSFVCGDAMIQMLHEGVHGIEATIAMDGVIKGIESL